MSTWTVLGFLAIVVSALFAPEISRQIARWLSCPARRARRDRCGCASCRSLRLRVVRGGSRAPTTYPRALTSWRRFGLLQDRARWDDEFTARVKRELHR